MKAMVLPYPSPIEATPLKLKEVAAPHPGPGQVRLRVSACGLCHTDLHIVEGELPAHRLPLIPGHQIVGVVDRVGEGVNRLKEGERVGVAWLYSACGRCRFCQEGRENLCPQAQFTGYDRDGGLAQYAIASEDFAYPLPPAFTDLEAAPLLCAGIIGFRALRLSQVKPGQRLGLYGFGASAHLAIQVARHWGCRVFVFTRGQEHRHLAQELGAAWCGGPGEAPPEKLHSAIIFAPVGPLVPRALEALERGGTLALAGIYMSTVPELDYSQHLYYEKTVVSVTNSTRQDAQDFLSLAGSLPVQTRVEVYPLEAANQALSLLKQGRVQGAGVLEVG